MWLFKHRLKIVLIQESVDTNDTKLHFARKCDRLMSDSEKCAELEAKNPGIHTVYFIEDFATNYNIVLILLSTHSCAKVISCILSSERIISGNAEMVFSDTLCE